MVYVWRERKLIYLAAPATGSTAFVEHLKKNGAGSYVPAEDLIRDGRRIVPSKHSTIAEMRKGGLWENEFDSYTKVTGIRNPFSWYVAVYIRNRTRRAKQVNNRKSFINQLPEEDRIRYVQKIKTTVNQTFDEFLRESLDRPQPFELQAGYHEEVDEFLHQEILAGDARRLLEKIGAELQGRVQEFNVTGPRRDMDKYREYYTPELIDLVYAMNKPYFDRFPEYSFEGLDKKRLRRARKGRIGHTEREATAE
jgi:hypothetical protein